MVGGARRVKKSHRATCQRHRPFKNYELALEHYRAQVSEGRADPGQDIYRCSHCRKWHHGGAGAPSLGRLMAEAG